MAEPTERIIEALLERTLYQIVLPLSHAAMVYDDPRVIMLTEEFSIHSLMKKAAVVVSSGKLWEVNQALAEEASLLIYAKDAKARFLCSQMRYIGLCIEEERQMIKSFDKAREGTVAMTKLQRAMKLKLNENKNFTYWAEYGMELGV